MVEPGQRCWRADKVERVAVWAVIVFFASMALVWNSKGVLGVVVTAPVCGVLWLLMLRPSVCIRGDVVAVQNPLRRYEIARASITGAVPGQYGVSVYTGRRNPGRRQEAVRVFALRQRDVPFVTRADVFCDELEEWVTGRRRRNRTVGEPNEAKRIGEADDWFPEGPPER